MLENVHVAEEKKSVASTAKKSKVTVKELCQDEDIAAFFKLVVEKDLRKKAIESLEKRIFNIRTV